MFGIFKKRKVKKQSLRDPNTGRYRKKTIYDDPLVRERMEYEASKHGVVINWKHKLHRPIGEKQAIR